MPEGPVRQAFAAELEHLRLQVEVMGVRVDENLERTREVLRTGDVDLAALTVQADDLIDAMNVSLTERCYDLLTRESPVAGDLRFIVSVLRVLSELERIGDLALRVVKLAPEWELLRRHHETFDILLSMADTAVEQYRTALRAWAAQDLGLAAELADQRPMEAFTERFSRELLGIDGPDAVLAAVRTLVAGRSLDRIADHAAIIGARIRYLITGDPAHLTAEIR
ncbi:phosphate signaling complex protein PhoU [Iamia sp. SCSIO 61187]|uniref:phosphate signaling complex protein PhoU n=1 Tax=Iamia sp. SCSIO 61187 TaxID=2722752 RepID=UPI001C631CA8|nr:phosphate signaling complex protein PhoU [Iamia sp. SCSIO 61187]QYG91363.1 phosphate signaling complex protein PhoU [Iamia sp. SCSIO 61187]